MPVYADIPYDALDRLAATLRQYAQAIPSALEEEPKTEMEPAILAD